MPNDPTPIPAAVVEAALEAWGITYSNSHGDLALSMQAAIAAALPHLASPAEDVAGLVSKLRKWVASTEALRSLPADEHPHLPMIRESATALCTLAAERDEARRTAEKLDGKLFASRARALAITAERDAQADRLRVVEMERDKAQDRADELKMALDDALMDTGERMRDEE